jgi:signal transduction histidine kinase
MMGKSSLGPSSTQSVVRVTTHAARAHAIKNCLAIVHAVNALLAKDVGPTARERLARSQDAVRRILALVMEDMALPFSEAGDARRVLVDEIVRDVVASVTDRAEAGHVALVVRCGLGQISCHASAVTEALRNIVLNAIEATPAGGSVFLATRENRDGSQLWLIRDTGVGISKERLAGIGPLLGSDRKEGWGVGLAFAQEVIERDGGLLRLDSREDDGTMVSVWLPPPSRAYT